MALSPSIPTSFVPKQPVQTSAPRPKATGSNIFLIISFFLLGVAVVGSVAVFGYQQYLKGVIADKEMELAAAEERINFEAVEEFIRMRDRFSAGQELLDKHIALSQFLSVLENTTIANVRFSGMSFFLADDGTPSVEMVGVARNFNALAAQSNALSSDPRIKSAIFSGITVNPNNSVAFQLSAELSESLITMRDPADMPPPVVPAATSTPAATTTPVATSTPSAPSGTSSPDNIDTTTHTTL